MQVDWQPESSRGEEQHARLFGSAQFIAILGAALCLGKIGWAQKDAATILGTVEDPSEAVVPGAQVTITDVDRGTSFLISTNRYGDYIASPLKIGRYTVKVGKKDFKTAVIGPFDL
ncbi:MAG TPA: carboxypeptidase-like regulatory domain-containing protein, partial [Candidatus Acidoferrum sp.]|nr:carboxypeptidase-like regulatory domain-containing protein [Candidatus Acidoferrum sp.]